MHRVASIAERLSKEINFIFDIVGMIQQRNLNLGLPNAKQTLYDRVELFIQLGSDNYDSLSQFSHGFYLRSIFSS